MASKNRFNIVLRATINKEALQKELNKISETKIKINIDTEHLRAQIQNVFNNIKINIGGSSAGSGSSSGRNIESSITQSRVTKTYLDEQGKSVKELISGYDNLGNKITETNRIINETTRERISSTKEESINLSKLLI